LDIFEATDLRGRSFSDLGAGNGQVLFAAWFYGASNAWGLELSENPGNFFIYRAALSNMAKDRRFLELKRDCTFLFDLTGALEAGNIDQVAYVVLFGFTVRT
jgi:predicted RNA methylase